RFDYLGHLARQGVLVTASAWNGDQVERLPGRARGLRARLERWRERLAAAMAAAVRPPEGAVLRALIVGDEEGIDADLREAFTRAGVVHVLSISGLHVGLVAAAGFWLARRLLGQSERLLLALDVERLAALVSLGPVALYTALAGLGVATLRSAIMVAAAVLAGLLGRRADVLRTLALAALVLALVWPGTPLEIAFQLSFASVGAIVCGMRRLAPAAPAESWRARGRRRGARGSGRRRGVVGTRAVLGRAPARDLPRRGAGGCRGPGAPRGPRAGGRRRRLPGRRLRHRGRRGRALPLDAQDPARRRARHDPRAPRPLGRSALPARAPPPARVLV